MEYILYVNDNFRCENSVEDYDYKNKSTLYFENSIKNIIDNLPLYYIIDINQQISYRGYIGISKNIKFYSKNLDFFKS